MLTVLTVIINNICNVHIIKYEVSKVNPTSIIINQLRIIYVYINFINEFHM